MSTHGAIARLTAPGRWVGRYHHSDSYPSGLGRTLFRLYHEVFNRDLTAMLKMLIDDHPAGWSSIVDKDFNHPTGYQRYSLGPSCYCHGERSEPADTYTERSDMVMAWAYAFDTKTDSMLVYRFNWGNTLWELRETVALRGDEPDWDRMEREWDRIEQE